LKVICSYCREFLHEIEPYESEEISHGLCNNCFAHLRKQWGGLKLGEFLDDFEKPVLAAGEDVRIIAANAAMAKLLGKGNREVFGLLGGEVLECKHARNPRGCGRSIHCKACAIRNAVTHTITTGESLAGIPATLHAGSDEIDLLISTTNMEGYVLLEITEILEPDKSAPQTEKGCDAKPAGQ
jgi:hypothetical protein